MTDEVRTRDEERVVFEHELHEQKLLMQVQREALPNEFRGLPRLPERPRARSVDCVPTEVPATASLAMLGAFGIAWWKEWK